MLLACSVDTPIHINRSHFLALRVRVLCELGLMDGHLWASFSSWSWCIIPEKQTSLNCKAIGQVTAENTRPQLRLYHKWLLRDALISWSATVAGNWTNSKSQKLVYITFRVLQTYLQGKALPSLMVIILFQERSKSNCKLESFSTDSQILYSESAHRGEQQHTVIHTQKDCVSFLFHQYDSWPTCFCLFRPIPMPTIWHCSFFSRVRVPISDPLL